MKKYFLLIAILIAGIITVKAQDESPLVILAGQMKNLQLGNDLNVTLVNSNDHQPDVTVGTEVFNKLRISVENNSMKILPASGFRKEDKIFVIVNGLENLTVGQNTQVITHGIMSAPKVKVYVQAGATAHIVSRGKVNAFSLGGVDVTVEKRPLQVRGR